MKRLPKPPGGTGGGSPAFTPDHGLISTELK
jgi:hypothetical protein